MDGRTFGSTRLLVSPDDDDECTESVILLGADPQLVAMNGGATPPRASPAASGSDDDGGEGVSSDGGADRFFFPAGEYSAEGKDGPSAARACRSPDRAGASSAPEPEPEPEPELKGETEAESVCPALLRSAPFSLVRAASWNASSCSSSGDAAAGSIASACGLVDIWTIEWRDSRAG
jgi:hypothetical protein